MVPTTKNKDLFSIKKSISLLGNIGIEIYHYDNMSGTPNRNGIPAIVLKIDQEVCLLQGLNRS